MTNLMVRRARNIALGVAALGLAGGAAGFVMDREAFFSGYLVAFVFCWGLAGGALGLLMLHHLTAGGWGFSIQRILEASAKTMPLIAVMFLPILFGMHDLYHWTHADAVAADPLLQHKEAYLNVRDFVIRAAIYFAIWIALAFAFSRWSTKMEAGDDGQSIGRLQTWAGPSLVLYVLTTSFASIDWAMSTDPHWFSTIYGLIFVVGQALSAFAFAIVTLLRVRGGTDLDAFTSTDRLHDLGKLLFAFVMLWGYVNLSQFIVIWYGNLPEEIVWYVHRIENGFLTLTLLVVAVQFVIPFFFLLSRRPKRNPASLGAIATGILLVAWLGWFWMIVPGPLRHHLTLSINDGAWLLALGGLWVALFTHFLQAQSLLNRADPRLVEANSHGH